MGAAEFERACEMWRAMFPTVEDPTVDDYRRSFERFMSQFPMSDDVTVEQLDAGGVPALWVRTPESSDGRTVLYLHGGVYVVGSAHGYRGFASRIGRVSRARALVVDYRLAPEHPFPAAVDDSLLAYRWLLDNGTSPETIAIVGDSAGGGLTIATLLAIRDAGLPQPAAAVVVSPWVDLECSGGTMATLADVDPVVSRDVALGMAAAYLAGEDPRNPLASPLHGDLAGLPPLLIQVGSRETLLDDSMRLLDKARAAGLDVSCEVVDGAPHVWHFFSSMLPEGRDAIEKIGQYVRDHTR